MAEHYNDELGMSERALFVLDGEGVIRWSYVSPIGVNPGADRHAPKLREDFLSGVRSGVNGTPTLFINGVRHNGGYDLPTLLDALRDAL